ncbi:MAG: hypothetical protein V4627_03150 [Pseudomonadota bacterium]
MNAALSGWLAQALATDAPALPSAIGQQIWLHVGWSVVLACLGATLAGRWQPDRLAHRAGWPRAVALVLALWAWVPGPYAPAYWLGLAFQAPSMVAVLWCGALLYQRLLPPSPASALAPQANRSTLLIACVGVLMGWVLLLDTFARLPIQVYAWGFSPAALGFLLLLCVLPWLVGPLNMCFGGRSVVMVFVSLLLFAALRLPTGNVWDAVLDPWLWLVLHGVLVRRLLRARGAI